MLNGIALKYDIHNKIKDYHRHYNIADSKEYLKYLLSSMSSSLNNVVDEFIKLNEDKIAQLRKEQYWLGFDLLRYKWNLWYIIENIDNPFIEYEIYEFNCKMSKGVD